MAGALNDDELAAYFALRRAGDRMEREVTQQLREHGLTEVQFSVLATLAASEDGFGMSDLARALVVTKSGLTYQATQLESRGLVVRSSSPDDDRGVRLALTPEGARLLQQVMPGHVELVRELFMDRLAPDVLVTLRDALSRVGARPAQGDTTG